MQQARLLLILAAVLLNVSGGCKTMTSTQDTANEKAAISQVIHNSIGWAATKDTTLLFGSFAHDPELFWFSPRDDGTVHGFEAFVEQTNGFFMSEHFRALRYEIRELHITLAQSGTVAWYRARLNDFNEWQGRPANWENVRWTGVLEKRDGRWVIVQMHFSDATDRRS